jgi:hypothetical protein
MLLIIHPVVAVARVLLVLLVLQDILHKLVMAVSDCNPLLQAPLFITRAVAAGAVLTLAACCLTLALVEQAEAGTAVLAQVALELMELQIQVVVGAALLQAVCHLHLAVLVWLLSLAQLLRFQPQVLQQLPTQAVTTATSLLATVRSHSKVKYGTFCKTK